MDIHIYTHLYTYILIHTHTHTHTHIYIYIYKLANHSRGRPEISLFNSCYTNGPGRLQHLFLNCSTYP